MQSFNHPYEYNIGQRLDRISSEFGDKQALIFPDGSGVEYNTLASLSRGIASLLKQSGARKGKPIAIFSNKSALNFAASHAALRLGAPVVFLDSESPFERLKRILKIATPGMLVVDSPLEISLKIVVERCGVLVIDLSKMPVPADTGPLCETNEVLASDVAYIMFTSGSTGFPKGVAISHASVLNLANWARETFCVTPNDILTSVNPLYFDNSVFDHFTALLNGAALALFEKSLVQDPHQLVKAVEKASCTIWFSVPSLLVYIMRLRALKLDSWPSMRSIGFGGEGYPKADAKRLFNMIGDRIDLWNIYGPTEGACICSAYKVQDSDFTDMTRLLPLGHLASNFGGVILNNQNQPCASGEIGELCLMGPQLALGYWRAPELTAASFVTDPASDGIPNRIYRTGDLVIRDPIDGCLHFLGRKDNQIKHMGYRIELEEIEAAINGLDYITQAAVIYIAPKNGAVAGKIVAIFVSELETSSEQLRYDLNQKLPDYMMPSEFFAREALPKNANGKVDRGALTTDIDI